MNKIIFILISLLLLTSCQSAKDAFTLKKKSTADEFLVEKKSPLVLPPDYGKLPVPQDGQKINESKNNENIKNLVTNNDQNTSDKVDKSSKPTSIEKSILDKIR
tara:strand:+ start:373 stop:684 length:312 start_codon:yes stop_codon:yes gene_type:complete